MKKLVFGLIATVVFGFVGNAQDKNFSNFFSSKEFNQLAAKYSFKSSDVDTKNYGSIEHNSKLYKVYRVAVSVSGSKNFITFFTDDNGENYGLTYEKIDLSKGISSHLDEYGNLYATFAVIKSESSYVFTIKDVYTPSTSGNTVNRKSGCIEKTYRTLKNACQADDFCDMMCDLNPSCLPMLAAWAATYCLTH
ncbi:hypothetical protein [Flavobacterium sp.]|uniref:hypothetical protein n=1 Tax=Flavobacterium sp. TaxID=239 RepID=UPI002B4ADD65|nr:hypothetical protein [Flavobacterium sp.]HLP63211.1 hypothetical protein [Flavobacterium sp.]